MNKYTRCARTEREAFGHHGSCIEGGRGDTLVGWGLAIMAAVLVLMVFARWLDL